jgi:ubiquinone/menaquinone biosynthesis C-methylase UbiE
MAGEVCPFWVGYLLCSPIRRLWHNPEKILSPYIYGGMKALDIGCAMGFFSLPMARMVGPQGKVICIDVQERMIRSLVKRAQRAGLYERIETRVCSKNSLCLEDVGEEIDFALAFAVVHEVPDCSPFFSQVYRTLKPAGILLLAEPKVRISNNDFEESISAAQGKGFGVIGRPYIRSARAVLLQKQS